MRLEALDWRKTVWGSGRFFEAPRVGSVIDSQHQVPRDTTVFVEVLGMVWKRFQALRSGRGTSGVFFFLLITPYSSE